MTNTVKEERVTYQTEFQCDECLEWVGVEFDDPNESFSATCSHCGAHYPEVYV